jgi:hypothetical protein
LRSLLVCHRPCIGSVNAQDKTAIKPTAKGDATKLNIVLVHAIRFDVSCWRKVIPILQDPGHKVIVVA